MANGKTEAQVQTAKKKPQGRTTLKQKRLKDLIADNIRNGNKKSLGQLQREAGYSESTADAPSKVTKGIAWNENMDLFLPDDELLRVHKELINSATIQKFEFPIYTKNARIKEIVESVAGCVLNHIQKGTTYKTAYYASPDNQTRAKAIAEAYKVKNKYKPQEVTVTNKFTKESLDHIRLVLGA